MCCSRCTGGVLHMLLFLYWCAEEGLQVLECLLPFSSTFTWGLWWNLPAPIGPLLLSISGSVYLLLLEEKLWESRSVFTKWKVFHHGVCSLWKASGTECVQVCIGSNLTLSGLYQYIFCWGFFPLIFWLLTPPLCSLSGWDGFWIKKKNQEECVVQ